MYLLPRAFFATIDTYTMVYMYLIIRIRFRGSDFGLVAKMNIIIRQNRNRLLVRRWCSGHFFFACVIRQLGFWTQKQANVDYCYVRRRAECTSLGPGLEHLSLRPHSCLAAKRRADAFHIVFVNKASEPNTRAASALFILSHDT